MAAPIRSIARIGGGALLLASAAIHFVGWSEGGGNNLWVGLLGIAAVILFFGVLLSNKRLPVVLGVLFMALTSALQIGGLLAGTGYQERLPAPYPALSPYVHVAGLILLLVASGLLFRESPAARSRARRTRGNVIEPASLVPGPDLRTAEPIRWPSDRAERAGLMKTEKPSRRLKTAAAAAGPPPSKPLTPAASGEPVRWRGSPFPESAIKSASPPAPKPVAEARTADLPEPKPIEKPVGADPAPDLPAVDHVIRWRSSQGVMETTDAVSPVQTVVTVAEVAMTAEPKPQPALEPGPQPALEPAPLPTLDERSIFLDPVPMSIADHYYGLLARELEILRRLEAVLGPDDPRALKSRSVIAYYYVAGGDAVLGARLQEVVAADNARILGESHPHAVDARAKLGQWRKLAKKQRRAKASVAG